MTGNQVSIPGKNRFQLKTRNQSSPQRSKGGGNARDGWTKMTLFLKERESGSTGSNLGFPRKKGRGG